MNEWTSWCKVPCCNSHTVYRFSPLASSLGRQPPGIAQLMDLSLCPFPVFPKHLPSSRNLATEQQHWWSRTNRPAIKANIRSERAVNFFKALLRNWVCCLWGLLLRWYFFLFWIFSLVRRLEWKVYWKHLARPNPHFPYEIYLPMKHHVSKDRWDLPGYCEALQWSQEQEVQTRKQDYSHPLKILIELEISDCDGNLDDHSLPNSHFHLSFTFSFRW